MHIYLNQSLSQFLFDFIKLIRLFNFQLLLLMLFFKLFNACLHLGQDLCRIAWWFCNIECNVIRIIEYHYVCFSQISFLVRIIFICLISDDSFSSLTLFWSICIRIASVVKLLSFFQQIKIVEIYHHKAFLML